MISDLSCLTSNRKHPPELLIMTQRQQQHFNEVMTQSSGEKTREDVNIKYCSKPQHVAAAAGKSNNFKPIDTTSIAHTAVDDDFQRALLASQQQYRDEQQKALDEKSQIERAMKESLAVAKSSTKIRRRQHQQKQSSVAIDDDDIVVIDNNSYNDENLRRKKPAKQHLVIDLGDDEKMPANHDESVNNDQVDEEMDDIQKAIRLSLEDQNKSKLSINDEMNDEELQLHRVLSRKEFENVVNSLVDMQGGFTKLEKGKMVQTGNGAGEVKNRAQSRAQYGRYMIEDFWKLFDMLEDKLDSKKGESLSKVEENHLAPTTCETDKKVEADQSQSNSPKIAHSKITALVDIGHGLGVQVLQAGWTLDVWSRGIELMEGRHAIAEAIREGMIDALRDNPPDSTKADLKLGDLVHCVLPPDGQTKRDEKLREFVLFQDKPEEVQRGLVIFANNAEEVFSSRSNDSGNGECLDAHLAELFGNMLVGGRCVTLTDIRCHLTSKDDARWYHYESFESDIGAVSWSPNKSVKVHVLTKISDDWICSNEKYVCPPSNVANVETGRLTTECLYCGEAPRRQQQRNRRKRKIFSPDDYDG